MNYKFPIEECDVENKDSLQDLRNKMEEWENWLYKDDVSSIWHQIDRMLHNHAAFKFINEGRRLFIEAEMKNLSANNYLLNNVINDGYIATQTMAIRRLIEKKQNKDDRQPISIKRLVSDIKSHRNLLTRENYVAFDGLPYDYESARYRFYEQEQIFQDGKVACVPQNGPLACDKSEELHENFDQLAGITAENRNRKDKINQGVFSKIDKYLNKQAFADISHFADKMIAHAADQISRETIPNKELEVTLRKLETCHKILCQISKSITFQLLPQIDAMVPMVDDADDIFEHLDQPWLNSSLLESAKLFYTDYCNKIEKIEPLRFSCHKRTNN